MFLRYEMKSNLKCYSYWKGNFVNLIRLASCSIRQLLKWSENKTNAEKQAVKGYLCDPKLFSKFHRTHDSFEFQMDKMMHW